MNRRERILIAVIVICAAALLWAFFQPKKLPPAKCVTDQLEVTINDEWMQPLIAANSKAEVWLNYYACESVNKGDLVWVAPIQGRDPVVRQVVAAGGDHFELKPHDQGQGWMILINGEPLQGPEGKPFKFGSASPPVLSLYAKAHNGTIDPTVVLLFSAKSPGSLDSTHLGTFAKQDLLGKVVLQSAKTKD